jgi:enamine deaminase RidA (YjgF/YER057c/UK114 family)
MMAGCAFETAASIQVIILKAAAARTDRRAARLRPAQVVGLDAEKHWPVIGEAMNRLFGPQGPAATMVGVEALADPNMLFEADVTAVIR